MVRGRHCMERGWLVEAQSCGPRKTRARGGMLPRKYNKQKKPLKCNCTLKCFFKLVLILRKILTHFYENQHFMG